MRLSIITPYYNCLEHLKSLANVLIPQLNKYVEWIVVDDGTRDDLSFLTSEYAKVIHLEENSGCAGIPRNHGLDVASGEYITFVDADDLVSFDFVEKILEKIDDGFDYCLMSWKSDVFEIIRKINVLSVQGYPYLLNKAHNDVVITDRNIKELLKIAKIYETTNREVMSW